MKAEVTLSLTPLTDDVQSLDVGPRDQGSVRSPLSGFITSVKLRDVLPFLFFWGGDLHPQHMEVPRVGIEPMP